METRVALIGIIVENSDSVEKMNALLHEYGSWIIGRMGRSLPAKGDFHHQRRDRRAMDKISSSSGKLGMLDGVSTKTIYSRQDTPAPKN